MCENENVEKLRKSVRVSKLMMYLIAVLFVLMFAVCIILHVKVLEVETQNNVSNDRLIVNIYKDIDEIVSRLSVIEKDMGIEKPKEDPSSEKREYKSENVLKKDVKKVYLTFDDGPSPITDEILAVLDYYGVKATFFVLGDKSDIFDDDYSDIVNRGHVLALHSYSHDYDKIYESIGAFEKDLVELEKKLYYLTNTRSKIFRFPGGSSIGCLDGKIDTFKKYLNEREIVYYDWNVVYDDKAFKDMSDEAIANSLFEDIEEHSESIVLLHDWASSQKMLRMLPILIEKLLEDDIQILTIDEETDLIRFR